MDAKTRAIILLIAALGLVLGAVVERHAIRRYGSERAPKRWPAWRPRDWLVRQDWFVDSYGYRLSSTGRWMMFGAGLVGLVVSLL